MASIDADEIGMAHDSGLRRTSAGSLKNSSSGFAYPMEDYTELDEFVESEKPWVTGLVVLCVLDFAVCGVITSTSLFAACRDNGVTLFCIALQSTSHMMASAIVVRRLWKQSRFGERDSAASSLVDRRQDLCNEQKYGMTLGVVFLISCVALLVKAARKFHLWDEWAVDHATEDEEIAVMTEVLAWTAGVWFLLQCVCRFQCQRKLNINLLNHVWPVSAVGFLFCLCMALAASYEREGTWKADAVCASVLAVFMFCEGLRTIHHYFDDVDDVLLHEKRP